MMPPEASPSSTVSLPRVSMQRVRAPPRGEQSGKQGNEGPKGGNGTPNITQLGALAQRRSKPRNCLPHLVPLLLYDCQQLFRRPRIFNRLGVRVHSLQVVVSSLDLGTRHGPAPLRIGSLGQEPKDLLEMPER